MIPTAPPLADRPAAATAHYRFYDADGTHAAQIGLLSAEAEEIYAYVAGRTGMQLAEPVAVVVQDPATSDCAARGVTFVGANHIGIFADARTSPAQLRLVLAHETTHVLHFATVRAPVPDLTLSEGFANWASLPYWAAWQGFPSFEDATRQYLQDGRFTPLDAPPADCTILERDVIYNERASFVGYLLRTYGRDRFLAASPTHARAPGPASEATADYQAVYGKPFAELIGDWLAWVRGGATGS